MHRIGKVLRYMGENFVPSFLEDLPEIIFGGNVPCMDLGFGKVYRLERHIESAWDIMH